MKSLIDASAIHSAAHRIRKDIIRTATIESPNLSSIIKRPVYLKLENTQIGGSFKARGVLNKFAEIKSELPSQRFAAVSGGNFGIAIAQAAANLNAHVKIIMPKTAPASSIAKIRCSWYPSYRDRRRSRSIFAIRIARPTRLYHPRRLRRYGNR